MRWILGIAVCAVSRPSSLTISWECLVFPVPILTLWQISFDGDAIFSDFTFGIRGGIIVRTFVMSSLLDIVWGSVFRDVRIGCAIHGLRNPGLYSRLLLGNGMLITIVRASAFFGVIGICFNVLSLSILGPDMTWFMANRLLSSSACDNRISVSLIKIPIHAGILQDHVGRGIVEGAISRHPVKRIESVIQTF